MASYKDNEREMEIGPVLEGAIGAGLVVLVGGVVYALTELSKTENLKIISDSVVDAIHGPRKTVMKITDEAGKSITVFTNEAGKTAMKITDDVGRSMNSFVNEAGKIADNVGKTISGFLPW